MNDRPGLGAWFGPRVIGLHLFAIAAIGFCLFMGTWQLGVYDQRQVSETEAGPGAGAVALQEAWSADDVFTKDQDQLPVTVTGTFRPANEQFWVTGREQDGYTGAWLVAPVTVDDAQLLVVRGWAAQASDAAAFGVPVGESSFEAVLQPGDAGSTGWDPAERTIGSVRIPTLLNELGYDNLWSGYAISTDPGVAAGLTLAEVPESEVSWTAGGRNLGYGLQWWVFAAFALFMWWRMAREIVLGEKG